MQKGRKGAAEACIFLQSKNQDRYIVGGQGKQKQVLKTLTIHADADVIKKKGRQGGGKEGHKVW